MVRRLKQAMFESKSVLLPRWICSCYFFCAFAILFILCWGCLGWYLACDSPFADSGSGTAYVWVFSFVFICPFFSPLSVLVLSLLSLFFCLLGSLDTLAGVSPKWLGFASACESSSEASGRGGSFVDLRFCRSGLGAFWRRVASASRGDSISGDLGLATLPPTWWSFGALF